MKRTMSRKIIYRTLIAGTFFIALVGILLPGLLLIRYREREIGQVASVPAEYYSAAGSAMARNASANLGVYQKLQLITGKWESRLSEAASYEMDMEDYEAVAAAREGLKELYENGLYPSSVSTDYGNWYTWEAERYKAVDAVFQTYTAYYWEITFSKYDGTEHHTVYLLEDGTVFYAEAELGFGPEPDFLQSASDVLPAMEDAEISAIDTEGENLADWAVYSAMDITGMQLMSLAEVTKEEETCYVLQAYSKSRYLYTIIPQ